MRILLCSHAFAPSIGGIESVSGVLGAEFARAGHDVTLVTATPGDSLRPETFAVVRRPDPVRLLRLYQWSDVIIQNNVSVRTLWPALLIRRPVVIIHAMWLPAGLAGWAKRAVACFASNLGISRAICRDLLCPAQVLGNPYDNAIFMAPASIQRDRDLVFVGRLIRDKGCDLLVDALALLRARGCAADCTIVGYGPERASLEAQAQARGLADRVQFAGPLTGGALAACLARHRILVVPSRWAEPFGVVALEGIASGCVAVGSRDGGLADAIGPAGRTFANGDAAALAACLDALLHDETAWQRCRQAAPEHLRRHLPDRVAGRLLAAAAAGSGPGAVI